MIKLQIQKRGAGRAELLIRGAFTVRCADVFQRMQRAHWQIVSVCVWI
ncbi:hypothetical protein [Magnetofaba australis]|nr:hypothetical protein [Magnetofaba australis]